MTEALLIALALLAVMSAPPKGTKGTTGKLSQAEIRALAKTAGFADPHVASAVAMAESGGNPGAIGVGPRERSVGLWQINTRTWKKWSEEQLKDPFTNALAAAEISHKGATWSPWSAYTNGSYKHYL